MKKLYCIRKFLAAENAFDAMQKERNVPIHDIYIDDSWMRDNAPAMNRAVGLPSKTPEDSELDTIQ